MVDTEVMEALISPDLMKRLEQLQLLARRRSKSTAKGERRSGARGQSVEFADYRTYVPGDDLRRIDWNLFGRLERLFLKLYEEERELPVTIYLDSSESMSFGPVSKFDFARQVAAAVGYVALCGFDRVTVEPFPLADDQAGLVGELRTVRGRRSALRFFDNLNRLKSGGAADFNQALRLGSMKHRAQGVIVVLSDFLDPSGYEAGLKALAYRGSEVHAVQILAPEELEPSSYGDLRVIDSETGAEQEVTFGKYRLKAYRATVQNYCRRLQEYCRARGIRYQLAQSDTPIDDLLLKAMRTGGMWR
ncbi:MAG: DUF58 domain-containing protein [Verrucomicrobiales bacterium]|nr:DUF58 domain-containing protein [Verrucomicrobiales bacterium]